MSRLEHVVRGAVGIGGRPESGSGGDDALSQAELTELRAALAAGASPAQALAGLDRGVLRPVAQAIRLGRPIAQEATTVDTGDPGADLLVRALGVAERVGVGGIAAVDQALQAVRDGQAMKRLLRIRSAQARGTARVLTAVPVCAWVLLIGLDPRSLAFYATPLGIAAMAATVVLFALGRRWAVRLLRQADDAGTSADPLMPARPRPDPWRATAAAAPLFVAMTLAAGPVAGVVCAALAAARCARPAHRHAPTAAAGGGAAEAVELVATAMQAGLTSTAAVAVVAPLGPPLAREALTAGARRLRGGWSPAAAFGDTGLASAGEVLDVTERYGAPAAAALRDLAHQLRYERRAAAEEAAEKVQLALVFPTTLLTLPAFALGVVPPLLWTALRA